MWTLLTLTAALAGSISIQSENPVGITVDGEVISPGTRTAKVDDLSAGTHVVQITTLAGNPIDTYEVDLLTSETDVELVVVNRKLQRVREAQDVERFAREFGPEPIDDVTYQRLLKKLVKGSAKRKFKRLTPFVYDHWFTIRQVQDICRSWDKIEERAAVARMMAPKAIDPENAAAMDSLFPSIRYRQEVHDAYGIP